MIQNKEVSRIILEEDETVVNLVLSPENQIVACCISQIYVCDISPPTIKFQLQTIRNPKGLISVRAFLGKIKLAFPNENKGHVTFFQKENTESVSIIVNCHNNHIDMLTLSDDANILATASVNGRNIKIFDLEKGA